MRKHLLTHGIWLLLAASAFVLGSQFFPAEGDATATDRDVAGSVGGASESAGEIQIRAGKTSASSRASRAGGATRNGRPIELSEEEIAALGERFRGTSSPVERRLAFSKLLDGLTAENALQIREQVAHLDHRSAEFREFHYAWGAVAGAEAAMFGAETEEDDMAPALAGWANKDASAAIAWLENLEIEGNPAFEDVLVNRKVPADQLRQHLMHGLVQGMANADPKRASDFLFALPNAEDRVVTHMMHTVAEAMLRTEAPEEVAGWAIDLPEGDLKHMALRRAANHYARKDLEAAVGWAEGIETEREAASAIAAVSSHWASREPVKAIGWLTGLPASDGQRAGMARALHQWAGRDAVAASEFLVEMPASQAKDAAIAGFSHRLVWQDPEAAMTWAQTIVSEKRRTDTLVGAAHAWRRKDPEAAAAWVMASGLPVDVQDRILNSPRPDGDKR